MSIAGYTVRNGSAVIVLDNPPVNGFSHALRKSVVDGIDAAHADDRVKSIIIIGSDRKFSAGADIRELGTPNAVREPTLNTVIRVIEAATKPVVAAIGGFALGGGLELAMSCNHRVAAADAVVGLPEVNLGILPGAGGTQRLPRLVGVETALQMILSGSPVPVEKLSSTSMCDSIADGDLLDGALAYAAGLAGSDISLKRVRDVVIDYPNPDGFFAIARNAVAARSGQFPAPVKCVDAVYAAATKSFDEGLKVEREAFLWLVTTPESHALRHAFVGERAASKIPDVPADTPCRDIAKIAVVGAGTMGRGIAMAFINAGIPVVMVEHASEALARALTAIRGAYESSVRKGRLTAADVDTRMTLLTGTLDYRDIASSDLVIEAVFEEMGVKENVFKALDDVMRPGAILASNTSTLDLNRIAGFTRRAADVVGMHFFSPAHVMRLLEVVRGSATAKEVLATVMKLARKIGKVAVVSGVCDGFIGNRMLVHYIRAAGFLVEEGATPQQVDRALEKWGMAMGPFRMGDLAGLDISWAVRKRRYIENPGILYPKFVDRLCDQGRFGQKTGRGWYLYDEGKRDPLADPEVERMLSDYRCEAGIVARKVTDSEIVERCIYALINEGARVLDEGIAQRASDIDMVYLMGYGFPAWRGGPLLFADETGLYDIERTVRRFAADTGDRFWEPAPLLSRLAAEGRTFN